jgi:hypothetical protein
VLSNAGIAEDLVRGVLVDHRDEETISLLAIAVSHLEAHAIVQLELPLGLADEGRRPGTKKGLARSRADRAVDVIRKRFGGQRWIMGQGHRLSAPSPTSSDALLKESYEYRQRPLQYLGSAPVRARAKDLFATTKHRRGLELRALERLPDGRHSAIYGIG